MTAASSPQNNQEAVIGKYRPILELGRGGMANVYLCMLQGLGGFSKLQVVKRLRPEFAEEPDFRTMFLEEARLAARINHINVVQTNEVGIDGNNLFIAMEYLEGQSLEELIRRAAKVGKPLQLSHYLPILVDALRGLHFAHELKDFQGRALKVIHRDVSPHNIFVTYDGQVKVVDFGIAKAADSSHETRTGIIKGKVAYMAPEQISSKHTVDRRADIFACGAIMWRALTGKRLWRGMNDMEILVKITNGEIPSPTTEKADIDPELVDICMKALAPKADERYQTAQDMIDALDGWLRKHPPASAREIGAFLIELFADRRKEIQQAIEKRITQAEANPGGWEEVQFAGPISRASFTPSHVSAGYMTAHPEFGPNSSATLPALADASANFKAAPPDAPTVPPPGTNRRARTIGIVIGAALLVGAIGGTIAVLNSKSTPKVVTTTPSPQPDPSASVAAAKPKEVELQIKINPADAQVFIDDKALTSASRFYQDGAVHRVRVAADKYEPEVRLITFDSPTVTLDFDLHRIGKTQGGGRVVSFVHTQKHEHEQPVASVTVAPPPPPPPVTTVAPPPPPPATTSKLGLDTSNPWK